MSNQLFKATFQQPINELNPIGARIAGPIEVEVFHARGKWHARNAQTKGVYSVAHDYAFPESCQLRISSFFEKQLTPWSTVYGDIFKPPPRPAVDVDQAQEMQSTPAPADPAEQRRRNFRLVKGARKK